MIPAQNIVAWGNVVPWADQRQVEQDPIISRALVEIFVDDMLRDAPRVRGGTDLNKLHFPAPLRYSEDIDLVRTAGGAIGPILDRLRLVLEPWLGRAQFGQSPVAPKLRFRAQAEAGSGARLCSATLRCVNTDECTAGFGLAILVTAGRLHCDGPRQNHLPSDAGAHPARPCSGIDARGFRWRDQDEVWLQLRGLRNLIAENRAQPLRLRSQLAIAPGVFPLASTKTRWAVPFDRNATSRSTSS